MPVRSPARLAAPALVALTLLLAACIESVHPISDAGQAAPDPALYGVWHGRFDGDDMYLHVGPGDRGMTRAVTVEHKQKDGAIKVERYVAFPTRVGKLAMLNVKSVDDPERDHGYLLFKYQAGKKRLTLWLTSYGAVREDIKAGKLAGRADAAPYGDTVITASGAELAQYLQASDPRRLFDKPLVFRRMASR